MKNIVFPVTTTEESQLPYFANGMAAAYVQEHINRVKGFPTYLWLQTRSGSGSVVFNEHEYAIAEGQGVLLFPNEPHEYYPESEEWIVDWVSLTGQEAVAYLTKEIGIKQSGVFFLSRPESTRTAIEQLVAAEQSTNPLKNLDISALVYTFLIQLYQNISSSPAGSLADKHTRLVPILKYIDDHAHEAIALKDLADLLDVTPQHLCTLFRKIMNSRIFEFINRVRIKKSKELLLEKPHLSIREIAHANGFEDVSYFCYIFKRFENTTPGDFRKRFTRS